MRMIFAYLFSMLSDYLLRTDRLSRTNVRKLATGVCKWREDAIRTDRNWLYSYSAGCGVKGLIVLALAYFGYNATAAIVLVAVATMFHGAVSSGPLASMVDLSPNYAGIVLGVSGMIGGMPGFISPFIVGILTQGNVSNLVSFSPFSTESSIIFQILQQTIEAWKNVFILTSAMLTGSGLLYVLFSESTLQPWNSGRSSLPESGLKELQTFEEKLPLKGELGVDSETETATKAKSDNW